MQVLGILAYWPIGLDLVVAAIAASNGEEQTDDMLDGENAVSGDVVAKLDAWGDAEEPTGADLIAAAFGESDPKEIDVFDEFGDSSDQLEAVDIEIAEEISSAASEIDITSESISLGENDDLPEINLIKINTGETGDEGGAVGDFDDSIADESICSSELGQDDISDLVAAEYEGGQSDSPVEPAESDAAEIDDLGPLDPDTFSEIFAGDDEPNQFD